MQRLRCRFKSLMVFSLTFALGLSGLFAAEPDAEDDGDVCPLIVIDEVPASDAIRNLARQLNLNLILDPRVPGSDFNPGKALGNPEVSIRCTNCAVSAVLSLVLARHKLKLTTNVATTVVRVVPATDPPAPAPTGVTVADTNNLLPQIILNGVPLAEAMQKLARQIQLKLVFDATFLSSALASADSVVHVSWQNISPRQALIALCENYGIRLVEDPAASTARVALAGPGNAGNSKNRP